MVFTEPSDTAAAAVGAAAESVDACRCHSRRTVADVTCRPGADVSEIRRMRSNCQEVNHIVSSADTHSRTDLQLLAARDGGMLRGADGEVQLDDSMLAMCSLIS